MTRLTPELTRRAVLFTFAAVLGKYDILKAAPALTGKTRGPFQPRGPGQLTVDLSQWGGIVFRHGGKSVTVSMAEVFDALNA
jgi:hypothetical protein